MLIHTHLFMCALVCGCVFPVIRCFCCWPLANDIFIPCSWVTYFYCLAWMHFAVLSVTFTFLFSCRCKLARICYQWKSKGMTGCIRNLLLFSLISSMLNFFFFVRTAAAEIRKVLFCEIESEEAQWVCGYKFLIEYLIKLRRPVRGTLKLIFYMLAKLLRVSINKSVYVKEKFEVDFL